MRLQHFVVLAFCTSLLVFEACSSAPVKTTARSRNLKFQDDSLSIQKANRELFTQAAIRLNLGDHVAAVRQLRAMRLPEPDGAVELLYAKAFQSMVQLDSAELHARKAADLLSSLDEPLLLLANIQLSRRRFADAATSYEQAFAIHPHPTTAFSLAQCYEQLNDVRAIKLLRDLVDQTEDLTALFELASVYEKRGMSTEYVQCMERIMNEFPAQSLPFQDYFQSLLDTRNYNQALNVLETRVEFSPELRREHRMRFVVHVYEDTTFHDEQILQRFVDLSVHLDSNNADAFEMSGLVWLRMNDSLRAERDFYRCAVLDSGSSAALRMGGYLFQSQKSSTAQDLLSKLYAAKPNNAELAYYCGLAYSYTSANQSALRYLKLALQLNASHEAAWNQLGLVYDRLEQRSASDSCYEQCLKVNPDNISALNNLAYSYAEQGIKLEKALRMSGRALDVDSLNDSYLDTYGWILHKKGDYVGAATYLERAVRHSGNSATLFEHLGDNYAKLGQRASAVEAWRRALEMDSSKTYLRERLLNSK